MIRVSCPAAFRRVARRPSVAAAMTAKMPTESSSRPRPLASKMSRSLLIVV
ncbi:Uncharacterised protein [Mycobacteroides abscessus subsp. abscessus]|nr:Uncharacterised protein [Mycobacteroides abscessus subsp. abscessus]